MSMLVLLTFLTLLIGTVCGMRFKVFILVPAIGLCLVGILAGGIGHGHSVSAALMATMLALGSLQMGYLCGIVARYGLRRSVSNSNARSYSTLNRPARAS